MRGICNFKMLYFSIALIPLLRKRKNFLPSMPKDRGGVDAVGESLEFGRKII